MSRRRRRERCAALLGLADGHGYPHIRLGLYEHTSYQHHGNHDGQLRKTKPSSARDLLSIRQYTPCSPGNDSQAKEQFFYGWDVALTSQRSLHEDIDAYRAQELLYASYLAVMVRGPGRWRWGSATGSDIALFAESGILSMRR